MIGLVFTQMQDNPHPHPTHIQMSEGGQENERGKRMGNKFQVGWKQPKNLQRIAGGVRGG